MRVGDTWCETLAVTGYPREVAAGWLAPLLSYGGPVDVAIHVEPMPAAEATRHLRRQLARLESTRRIEAKRDRLADPELDVAASDASELAATLARGEGRLFRVGLYVTVRAHSEEALAAEMQRVRALCSSMLLETRPVTFRAQQGWITTLPLGLDAIRWGCSRVTLSDRILLWLECASWLRPQANRRVRTRRSHLSWRRSSE